MKRTAVALSLALSLAVTPARAGDFKELMCNMCTLSNGNAAACTVCNIMILWEFFDHNDAPQAVEDSDVRPPADPDGPSGPRQIVPR